jgi:hypothetical protein
MIIGFCIGCGHPKRLNGPDTRVPTHENPFSDLAGRSCPGSDRLPLLFWDPFDPIRGIYQNTGEEPEDDYDLILPPPPDSQD